MIRLHFFKSESFVARIIRWFTWSDISHVAIEVDGYIYESAHDTGVIKLHHYEWSKKPDYTYTLHGLDPAIVRERLEAEVGAKYDWLNLFMFMPRIDWQSDDRWTCSELIAYAIREILPTAHYHRVSPRHLFVAAHANEHAHNAGLAHG